MEPKNLWPVFYRRGSRGRCNESKVCDCLMTLHFLVTIGWPGKPESRAEKIIHGARTIGIF